MWAGIAVVVFIVATAFDYRWLKTLAWPIYGLQLGLLVLTLLIGDGVGGSARWIAIGPLTFQFSELAKILMIIVLANYLSAHGRVDSIRSRRSSAPACSSLPPLALVDAPAGPRDLAGLRRDPRRDAVDVRREPEVAGRARRRRHRPRADRLDLHPARLPEAAAALVPRRQPGYQGLPATSSTRRRSRSARGAGWARA